MDVGMSLKSIKQNGYWLRIESMNTPRGRKRRNVIVQVEYKRKFRPCSRIKGIVNQALAKKDDSWTKAPHTLQSKYIECLLYLNGRKTYPGEKSILSSSVLTTNLACSRRVNYICKPDHFHEHLQYCCPSLLG